MSFLFAVAPMIDYTDRHARYLYRLISPHVRLYTEMVTANSLIYGNPKQLLAHHVSEKYLALQLAGYEPHRLQTCAKLGEDAGFDEVNLNIGCPSSRVLAGKFGACLMLEPHLVAECINAMQKVVKIPVTIKCRLGVDHHDSYEYLHNFITLTSQTGCKQFIIHARKAWLSGLSPKENRTIPPLCYDIVRRIKQDFPHLIVFLNGGLVSLAQIIKESYGVDGVMIGRAIYNNPFLLAEIESRFYRATTVNRLTIVETYLDYMKQKIQEGVKLSVLKKPLLGLFHGQKNGARVRRYLSSQQPPTLNQIQEALNVLI